MACQADESKSVEQVKWTDSTFYKEALDNVVLYNAQIIREKISRLPYIDAQTGIAQKDCHLWRGKHERMVGNLPGQIYSYPSRRWRLETVTPLPQPIKKALSETSEPTNGTTGSGGLVQSVEGGVVTKRSSRLAGLKRDESSVTSTTSRVTMESPISSEMNEEESDKDMDFIDEYDSEEEKRLKKKRKTTTRTRIITAPQKITRDPEKEKPYACTACNRRYKTQASLKAHQTQYHAGESISTTEKPSLVVTSGGISAISGGGAKPEEAPVVKKRNPYCDFCLGDDDLNQKLGKPEKMVSCADCGRSAHPSCLQFSPTLAAVVLTYRWQCIECKSCSLCGKSDNDDQLLFCDDCDRGYHMYCLKPPMKEAPEGSWSCGMCKTHTS